MKDKINFCQFMHKYAYLNQTYNISNVGKVSFGEELDAYVECVKSVMGANSTPIIIEIVQYKQTYNIVYCTRLKNDPYINTFIQTFLQAGIPCTYEKSKDFSEALVVF